MYPTISHLLNDLIGINVPLPIATFGFFLIVAIYAGGIALTKEIKRRKGPHTFPAFEETFVEGKPPSIPEILLASLWSFLIGYKLVEAFLHYSDLVADPQALSVDTWSFHGRAYLWSIHGIHTIRARSKRSPARTQDRKEASGTRRTGGYDLSIADPVAS